MLFQGQRFVILKLVEGYTNIAKFQRVALHCFPKKLIINQVQPSSELQNTLAVVW